MRFEWHEEKNSENIRKHGLDFSDVCEVFESPMAVNLDDRKDSGEDRWIAIGLLRTLTVIVVYVERDTDCIRIIFMRKANQQERKKYEKFLQDRLG